MPKLFLKTTEIPVGKRLTFGLDLRNQSQDPSLALYHLVVVHTLASSASSA